MNKIQKIFYYFLICISIRLYFAYLAKTTSKTNLKYMGYIAIGPAIGFMYMYFNKMRTVGDGAFKNKIWWSNLRPLHSILYALFAYNAIKGKSSAYMYLLIDVLIGIGAFLNNHNNAGSFAKLYE